MRSLVGVLLESYDTQQLAQLAMALREENRLCLIQEESAPQEPRIICSLGLPFTHK